MRTGLLALIVGLALVIVALERLFDEAPLEVAAIEGPIGAPDSEPGIAARDGEVALVEPEPLGVPVEEERLELTPETANQLAIARLSRRELGDRIVELEADRARLQGLLDAQAELAAVREAANAPSWGAAKVVGPPDAEPNQDDPHAWASAAPDGGFEWLDLRYKEPMRAHTLRVYEVNVSGALVSVTATDPKGGSRVLWSGSDPTPVPGVFEITFDVTPDPVQSVRITLDTSLHEGWNEIDAVELVGPGGRAWVWSATASSSFGQSVNLGSVRVLGR